MSIVNLFAANLAALALLMFALWVVSWLRRDVSIVDIFWGIGFVLVSWLSYGLTTGPQATRLALGAMVAIWGLRLAGYLTWRNWGEDEDSRYGAMRERHGEAFPIVSLFTVFLLQGALIWIISWPIQVAMLRFEQWDWLSVCGVAFWLVGLLFESIGDYQLARFKSKAENEGKVMDQGLWSYTRHPNYFGDFLVWWGLYMTTVESASWWWTILSPLLMSLLLVRVSGVRLLEESLNDRKEGYQEYVRRTSPFFPMPPKS